MSNFIMRIRRALGLAPRQSLTEYVDEHYRRAPAAPSPVVEPTFYDLSKPTRQLRLVGSDGVPIEGWRRYWQDRNRDADRALAFTGREFARVVLEALHG